jgi:hypothetical protein
MKPIKYTNSFQCRGRKREMMRRKQKQSHHKSQNNVSYLDCWKERLGVVKKEKKKQSILGNEKLSTLHKKEVTVGIDGKQGLHFISSHYLA